MLINKNIRLNIFSVLLFTLLGCISNPKDEFESHFNKTSVINLKSHSLNLSEAEANLGFMFDMEYFDSLIFVNDLPDPKYCMKIVDLRKNKILNFAKKGPGPNEMPSQSCDFSIDRINRHLYLRSSLKLYKYSIDSIKLEKYSPISQSIIKTNTKHFLATTYNNSLVIGSMFEKRFGLYNCKTDSLIEKYDYSDMSQGVPLLLQSFLKCHPNKPKVAYFLYNAATIGFLKVSNLDFTIEEISWWQPDIKEYKSLQALVRSKSHRNGFIAATVDEEYIYALYSGKPIRYGSLENLNKCFLSNYIYVMDWQGKPVKRYKLDQEVRSIAIDKKNNVIYAASYEDSCHIVKYKIK